MPPSTNLIEFGQWLKTERNKRGWTQSDLARKSGKNRSIINKIESGSYLPGTTTFIALANALQMSPLILFRRAGLMAEVPEKQTNYETWQYILSQLTPTDEDEIRTLAELKINQRQKETSLKFLRAKKA
jgi:transcriptional regulator with XRE-family HTH domain